MTFIKDIRIYAKCPEIRRQIFQVYLAKAAGLLTLVVFSPMILMGIISIGIVQAFDFIGQWVLWPAHKITDWLHDYQRDMIRSAHSILDIDTIQKRIDQNVD